MKVKLETHFDTGKMLDHAVIPLTNVAYFTTIPVTEKNVKF